MKDIMKNTFWQLMVIYTLFILAIALGFFSKYYFYFNILALIIGILGISLLFNNRSMNKGKDFKIHGRIYWILFSLAIILALVFRIIPYIKNKIPLGYDAGLYKYVIERGLTNLDQWVVNGTEPGFLYFMSLLNTIISTQFLLIYGFIAINILLGIAVYIFAKEHFGKNVALFSILIFAISLVQFKLFTFLYYKNILALSFLLFSFVFLKKNKWVWFTLFGILIGITHRPTFYIFGLSYLAYVLTSPYSNKHYNMKKLSFNALIGTFILGITLLFYSGDFRPAILGMIYPVLSSFVATGESPGTFISFFTYQFSTLFYLPLALLGFFNIIKNKKFDIFFFYITFTAIIVYFQFFFFNRFIIFLDIGLIILAGIGSIILIKEKQKVGLVIVIALLASGAILTTSVVLEEKPKIPQGVFDAIDNINIPKDAYIISFSSEFSPYLQGYTENRIIAPGMFDYNIWNKAEWGEFWQDLDASELKELYGDVYLFTTTNLNNECYEEESRYLYKYDC